MKLLRSIWNQFIFIDNFSVLFYRGCTTNFTKMYHIKKNVLGCIENIEIVSKTSVI